VNSVSGASQAFSEESGRFFCGEMMGFNANSAILRNCVAANTQVSGASGADYINRVAEDTYDRTSNNCAHSGMSVKAGTADVSIGKSLNSLNTRPAHSHKKCATAKHPPTLQFCVHGRGIGIMSDKRIYPLALSISNPQQQPAQRRRMGQQRVGIYRREFAHAEVRVKS
jgi:hypothetical protein